MSGTPTFGWDDPEPLDDTNRPVIPPLQPATAPNAQSRDAPPSPAIVRKPDPAPRQAQRVNKKKKWTVEEGAGNTAAVTPPPPTTSVLGERATPAGPISISSPTPMEPPVVGNVPVHHPLTAHEHPITGNKLLADTVILPTTIAASPSQSMYSSPDCAGVILDRTASDSLQFLGQTDVQETEQPPAEEHIILAPDVKSPSAALNGNVEAPVSPSSATRPSSPIFADDETTGNESGETPPTGPKPQSPHVPFSAPEGEEIVSSSAAELSSSPSGARASPPCAGANSTPSPLKPSLSTAEASESEMSAAAEGPLAADYPFSTPEHPSTTSSPPLTSSVMDSRPADDRSLTPESVVPTADGEPTPPRQDTSNKSPIQLVTNWWKKVGAALKEVKEERLNSSPSIAPSSDIERMMSSNVSSPEVQCAIVSPRNAPTPTATSLDSLFFLTHRTDGAPLGWPEYVRRLMYPPTNQIGSRYPWYPFRKFEEYPWPSIQEMYHPGSEKRRIFYACHLSLTENEIRGFRVAREYLNSLDDSVPGDILRAVCRDSDHRCFRWMAELFSIEKSDGDEDEVMIEWMRKMESFLKRLFGVALPHNDQMDGTVARHSLRYAQLEDFQPAAVLERCVGASIWLARHAPFIYDGEYLRPFLSTGAIYLDGSDTRWRPILVINVGNVCEWRRWGVMDVPNLTSIIVAFWIGFFVQHLSIPGKIEQLTLLIEDYWECPEKYRQLVEEIVHHLTENVFTHLPGYIAQILLIRNPSNVSCEEGMSPWGRLCSCGTSTRKASAAPPSDIFVTFEVPNERVACQLAPQLRPLIRSECMPSRFGGSMPPPEDYYPPRPQFLPPDEQEMSVGGGMQDIGGVLVHGRAVLTASYLRRIEASISPTDHINCMDYVMGGVSCGSRKKRVTGSAPRTSAVEDELYRVAQRIYASHERSAAQSDALKVSAGGGDQTDLHTLSPSAIKMMRRLMLTVQTTDARGETAIRKTDSIAHSALSWLPIPIEGVAAWVWEANLLYWYGRDRRCNPNLLVKAKGLTLLPSEVFCRAFRALVDWGMRYLVVEGRYDRFNLLMDMNEATCSVISPAIGACLQGLRRRYPGQMGRVFVIGGSSTRVRRCMGRSILEYTGLDEEGGGDDVKEDGAENFIRKGGVLVEAAYGSSSLVRRFIARGQMDPSVVGIGDVKSAGVYWTYSSGTPKAYFPPFLSSQ